MVYDLKDIWTEVMIFFNNTDDNDFGDDFDFWDNVILWGVTKYLQDKGVDTDEEMTLVDTIIDEIKDEYQPI